MESWLDSPVRYRGLNATRRLTVIAIFTSLAIATDYAMAPIANVKLVFTLVFASAYAFGFKTGATMAILTEFIWGVISPYGAPTLILPFLMGATVIYAFAGWGASKIWGYDIRPASYLNIFFGSIIAICAFVWDTTTNFGTALIQFWPNLTLEKFIFTDLNPLTLYFTLSHEVGDFVLGSALAPVIIVYFLKVFGRPGNLSLIKNRSLQESKIPTSA
jgi:hypothetical protein